VLVEYALAAEKEREMSRFGALLDATRKQAQPHCHNLPIAMTFDRNPSER
jgi:hypothetical protein